MILPAWCQTFELSELEQQVLAKKPMSVRTTDQIGAASFELLSRLSRHQDAEVRMIALGCLRRLKDERLVPLFVQALADDSPTASVEALRGLKERLGELEAGPLLSIYPRLHDAQRREQVALLLAQRPETTLDELRELAMGEQQTVALDALQVGMAIRGEHEAREYVLKALGNSWNEEMKRWLGLVELIDQYWVLEGVLPILDNEIPLVYLGVDGVGDHGPQYLRACDLALNIAAKIGRRRFPFSVDSGTQYSEEQRAWVKSSLLRS